MISWERVRQIGFQVAHKHHLEPWYDASADIEDLVQTAIEKLIKRYNRKGLCTIDGVNVDEPLLAYNMKHMLVEAIPSATSRPKRTVNGWKPPETYSIDETVRDTSVLGSELLGGRASEVDAILDSKQRLLAVMGVLTPQQVKVVFFHGLGYTLEEIASRLHVTEKAVRAVNGRANKRISSARESHIL